MKMKKVFALLLSVAMLASVTACGNDNNNTVSNTTDSSSAADESTEASSEETAEELPVVSEEEDTITIMVPPVTGTYTEKLAVWAKEFEDMYPHLHIEVIATSWDEHGSKLTTMALAGEAPDIAEVSYGAIGTYVEMGTAINIADYMEAGRLDDYDQNALDYMTLENTLYGLPLYITIQALGGNREMMEAVGADVAKIQTEGWTYEEFLDVIAAGTTNDIYGFVFGNSGVTTADFVSIFGVSAGISSSFTEDLKYAYTSENMLALLEAVETMTSSGYMPDYAVEAAQRLVMLETGEAMVVGKAMPLFESNVKKNNAGIADGTAADGSIEVEYVFLPVPTMEGATESVFGSVDGFIAMRNNNTTDEHLKNVCLFLDYICSGERAASVYTELYLTCVCESGRQIQSAFELDQSELNAAATARAISKVNAPPTGITAEMSAGAKTIMDEVIVPKFQALLAGETTAKDMYDIVCSAAYETFGQDNCASGWVK